MNCFDIFFFNYGNGIISLIVYDIFFLLNELICYDSCREDDICLGYIFCENELVCFLSCDKMFIDVLLCYLCCFYEKICKICMYNMLMY